MNSWFETSVLDEGQAGRAVLARMDYDLRATALTETMLADPRIVDPRLEEIVNQALTEGLDQARAEGFASGYADGSEQARAEVTAHVTTTLTAQLTSAHDVRMAQLEEEHRLRMAALDVAIEAVRTAASALESVTIPIYAELGNDLGKVVYTLVEDLLGHELSLDQPHVMGSISRAAAEIPVGAAIILRLNPADAQALQDGKINLAEVLNRPVQVVPDATVSRHSAFIDSDLLHVDYQITEALERMREVITS